MKATVLVYLLAGMLGIAVQFVVGESVRDAIQNKLNQELYLDADADVSDCVIGDLKEGDDCYPEAETPPGACVCGSNLKCSDDTFKCIPKFPDVSVGDSAESTLGKKCKKNDDCGEGFSCQKYSKKKSFCLHSPRLLGERCLPMPSNILFPCEAGLTCSTSTKKCE